MIQYPFGPLPPPETSPLERAHSALPHAPVVPELPSRPARLLAALLRGVGRRSLRLATRLDRPAPSARAATGICVATCRARGVGCV